MSYNPYEAPPGKTTLVDDAVDVRLIEALRAGSRLRNFLALYGVCLTLTFAVHFAGRHALAARPAGAR